MKDEDPKSPELPDCPGVDQERSLCSEEEESLEKMVRHIVREEPGDVGEEPENEGSDPPQPEKWYPGSGWRGWDALARSLVGERKPTNRWGATVVALGALWVLLIIVDGVTSAADPVATADALEQVFKAFSATLIILIYMVTKK